MQQRIPTFCAICAAHCAAIATVEDGKLVKWEQDKESGLHYLPCRSFKGLANIELANHPDRLKYPLKRVGAKGEGKWQRVSWDEALDDIAAKLTELKTKYGPQCLGASVGEPKALEFVWLQRFCSAFGTANICTPHPLCGATRYAATSSTWGPKHGAMNRPWVTSAEYPPKLIIIWGVSQGEFNAEEYRRTHSRVTEGGAKMVIIDPRRIRLTKFADVWLRPRPASDPALGMGLIKVIIDDKLYDEEFVKNWTVGFEELVKETKKFTLDEVEKVTWIPKKDIIQLAHWMGEYKYYQISTRNTFSQGARNFQAMRIVSILQTIVDCHNIPGWGWSEKRQFEQMPAGVQYLLDKFPRKLEGNLGADHRYGVRSAYIPTPDLIQGIFDDKIKAAIIVQCDPVVSFPDANRVYEAFKKLELLVVSEIFPSPTSAIADYVLPAATTNECDVISDFTGGMVMRAMPKIVEPPGEARSDVMILSGIARKLGLAEHFPATDIDTMNYILNFSGLTWEEFKKMRMNRPTMTPRPQESIFFSTPSGKTEIYSNRAKDLYLCDPLPTWKHVTNFPMTSEKYPMLVTSHCDEEYKLTGFKHIQYFRKRKPYPTVQLNPEVAASIGAKDGDWVWIETERGKIKQQLVIDPEMDPRVVMTSFGWWFPEEGPKTSYGWNTANVNVLFADSPHETATGSVNVRGFPCRVSKAEGGVKAQPGEFVPQIEKVAKKA